MRFALFCLVAAFTALASAQSPNRSGEAKLMQLFEDYKKLRKFEAVVTKSSRASKEGAMEASQTISLWYENPKRFRAIGTSMWGDAVLYVADGRTLFFDSLNAYDPRANLRNVEEAIYLNGSDLKSSGGFSTLLFYLLNGRDGYNALVSSDGDVLYTGNRISFKSKDLGTVTFFIVRTDNGEYVDRIEYDNLPKRQAEYLMLPMWIDKPDGPLEVELIRYNFHPKFSRDTFNTTPPKGVNAVDQRKRAGSFRKGEKKRMQGMRGMKFSFRWAPELTVHS